jgi:Mg2+-importing ATPase
MFFIGPISSLFDYITFGVLWFVIGANTIGTSALFQTGWFMEWLISQTLIVHMIRTAKIPFFQSRPSAALFLSTLVVIAIGLIIPFTLVGKAVSMIPMPSIYFFYLFPIVIAYCITTQITKFIFIRTFKTWL